MVPNMMKQTIVVLALDIPGVKKESQNTNCNLINMSEHLNQQAETEDRALS